MRRKKSFGIVVVSTVCVLIMLLAGEAGFVSITWAKKPDHTGKASTRYGYAKFRDADGDVIRSDGKDQYLDIHNEILSPAYYKGEDVVEIAIYADGSLEYVKFCPGRIKHHSTRRVNLCFDVSKIPNDVNGDPVFTENAVHDILRWYKANNYVERPTTKPGFLDDGSVHAVISINVPTGMDRVQFMVDPGWDGSDLKAITQTTVDDFSGGDENVDYWDTSEFDEYGQIIYNLEYGDDRFEVTPTGGDPPTTWIFTPKFTLVKLRVLRHPPSGKSGGTKPTWEKVYLAEYDALPFQFAVSLNPLIEYPKLGNPAPRKHNVLSILWGEIKAR